MIGWDNGRNELHNMVSDTYIQILGAVASIVFGLAMLYGAWSFGFTKDIGSSAGTYDILYKPVLSSETVHFSIKYVQDKLAMDVSADGVILGVILIVVQLGVTLYISTIGPMCPSKPDMGDLSAAKAWYVGDIEASRLNRVKLSLYLFLLFVIIVDNTSDTFYTVRLPHDASLGTAIALFFTMFIVAIFVNYVTSEMFVTLGSKLLFGGIGSAISLVTGRGARPERKRKKRSNGGGGSRNGPSDNERQQPLPAMSTQHRRSVPVRDRNGAESELRLDFP